MISADHFQRLAALNLSPEALQVVLAILAEIQGADDARREREVGERSTAAERQARYRERKARNAVTLRDATLRDVTSQIPPNPLKKERKIPVEEPKGSSPGDDAGPTQAELEKALYARGRQVCGKASGGLITSLLKTKQYDVALARAVIETASTKHDPREYIGAAIRNHNGRQNDPKSLIAALDRQIEHFGGMEAARAYVPGSSGPTPLCLDFGDVSARRKLIPPR